MRISTTMRILEEGILNPNVKSLNSEILTKTALETLVAKLSPEVTSTNYEFCFTIENAYDEGRIPVTRLLQRNGQSLKLLLTLHLPKRPTGYCNEDLNLTKVDTNQENSNSHSILEETTTKNIKSPSMSIDLGNVPNFRMDFHVPLIVLGAIVVLTIFSCVMVICCWIKPKMKRSKHRHLAKTSEVALQLQELKSKI